MPDLGHESFGAGIDLVIILDGSKLERELDLPANSLYRIRTFCNRLDVVFPTFDGFAF